MAIEAAHASKGRGQPLASLDASELSHRFYRWRGASGKGYICSVFPKGELPLVAGFSSAVTIGVSRDAGTPRAVCVMPSGAFALAEDRAISALEADSGVEEWHVHFTADDACARDLAASLLH
ncbi:hypothetical protein H2LOC_017580 [Methylocystis heyeri]|uniref:Uncharacterized protein n=1 Tax=Methylocystis heyeri TaxID=391905 RepID=A0A6B8KK92_9HYPH|nr:hypothetical protein H2LOC_017580 [Methylocystis heyeri]